MNINENVKNSICSLVLGASMLLPQSCATMRETRDGMTNMAGVTLGLNGKMIKKLASESIPENVSGKELQEAGISSVLLGGVGYAVATNPVLFTVYAVGFPVLIGTFQGVSKGLPEDIRTIGNFLDKIEPVDASKSLYGQ